jgi:(S)-2-hydroxy-acid oxidase
VDVPLLGRRLNEFRNDFKLPDGMEWPNLLSNGKAELNQDVNDHTQETHSYEFGRHQPDLTCGGTSSDLEG